MAVEPYSGKVLSATQVTLIRVCDGCALLLGYIAFRVHAACFSSELMLSSLKGHDVFLHSSSPFGVIVRQMLPGVNVNLHTCKVPFGMQPSYILRIWPSSQRSLCCLRREYILKRPAQDSTSAFVT